VRASYRKSVATVTGWRARSTRIWPERCAECPAVSFRAVAQPAGQSNDGTKPRVKLKPRSPQFSRRGERGHWCLLAETVATVTGRRSVSTKKPRPLTLYLRARLERRLCRVSKQLCARAARKSNESLVRAGAGSVKESDSMAFAVRRRRRHAAGGPRRKTWPGGDDDELAPLIEFHAPARRTIAKHYYGWPIAFLR
jgi:hypothetical protein